MCDAIRYSEMCSGVAVDQLKMLGETASGASLGSVCCRICHTGASSERLISPCRCRGSLAYVHLSCLERWLNQAGSPGRTDCELCMHKFRSYQTRRYSEYDFILYYRIFKRVISWHYVKYEIKSVLSIAEDRWHHLNFFFILFHLATAPFNSSIRLVSITFLFRLS